MNRLYKFLRMLESSRRKKLVAVLRCIESGEMDCLDISSLKGYKDHYRCRIGSVRIIFAKRDSKYQVVDIGFRQDIYKRWK